MHGEPCMHLFQRLRNTKIMCNSSQFGQTVDMDDTGSASASTSASIPSSQFDCAWYTNLCKTHHMCITLILQTLLKQGMQLGKYF